MKFILLLSILLNVPFLLFSQKNIEEKINEKFQNLSNFGFTEDKLNGCQVKKIEVRAGNIIELKVDVPEYGMLTFDEHDVEDFIMPLQRLAEENDLDGVKIMVRQKDTDNAYLNIFDIIQQNQSPALLYEKPKNNDPYRKIEGNLQSIKSSRNGSAPHFGQVQPTGALSGKTVWLSPGHGYIYYPSIPGYSTQRGNTNDMVEDFGSIEIVGYYLLKYLWNAGANVWMVRERDFNTNEVIVNNDDGAPSYTETGSWSTSASSGYNGSSYRYTDSNTSSETATATFTPTIPEAGWYWVSVYFREGTNRSVDTKYIINHAGGTTSVSVNQEVHGQTWNYIGQFYFDAGTSGSVTISNLTSDGPTVQAIIADAVRFGGGMGSEEDCDVSGVGTTGQSRFEEGAQLYAPFMGYSTCDGDVSIRPKYAEWELSKGTAAEQNDPSTNTWNSVYVSWHTNACCGGQGTSSFIYEPGTSGMSDTGTPTICDGSAGGNASGYLRNYIHDQVIDDIHAGWDNTWNDRGHKCAYFGEVGNLTTMPGTLLEMGFHDNPSDATAITTPYFRELEARAVYKGLVAFFNHYDAGVSTTLIPERPTHLVAENSGTGQITLSWNPPTTGGILGDAASSYNVYVSTHGKGFNDAIPVSGTSHTLTGLTPGTVYYFRVSAQNAGGESFPTSVVAARTPLSGTAVPILIVDGFDRLQRSQMLYLNEGGSLGNLYRGFLEKMNSYTYMVEHAQSIASCSGLAFDGATNEGIIDGSIVLTDYELVDWYVGEESTSDKTFDATEQNLIQTFLDGGGDIIVSGSEIGWDIGRAASANASLAFYNNYLKTSYLGDDSNSYGITGVGGDIFDGVGGSFDNGSKIYNVNFPDRLAGANGGTVALNYSSGTADGSAVKYEDPSGFGVVNFGFPLETVNDAATRNELICNSISYLRASLLSAEGLELLGEKEKGRNILTWKTLTEENTELFVLERSKDGFNYEEIHQTPAAFNSLTEQTYGYTDENPHGESYYRIKLIDIDGSYKYSNVVQLYQQGALSVTVFPNPNNGNSLSIRIDAESSASSEFTLYDVLGNTIFHTTVEENFEILQLPSIPTGTYHYIIERNNNTTQGKYIKI